jgi:hypothetical protein
MEQKSFKVSAEVLQKNATKASIRDLNAEFQRMGGKVIHKASKHGSVYMLSHPNDEYLEQFRIRLFKDLGLIEDKGPPKESKQPEAQAPRYGETHRLRKGWNVRSEKEVKEGRFDDPERINPWKDRRREAPMDRPASELPTDTGEAGPRRPVPRGRPKRKGKGADQIPPSPEVEEGEGEEHSLDQDDDDDEVNYKTFEERWGNIDDLISIVEEALKQGAVDDGEIIKFAYTKELPEPIIKKLKKQLWDNRCRGPRDKCPYKKKKFKFEDLMRAHYGKVDGVQNIDSPLTRFQEIWTHNIEEMFGPFRDKDVEVTGKISAFKPIYRKGFEHVKILVYDLKMRVQGESVAKNARKIWIRIDLKDYPGLTKGNTLRIEDIIKFKGRCVLDPFFHDHWIVNLSSIEVVREGQGEAISIAG